MKYANYNICFIFHGYEKGPDGADPGGAIITKNAKKKRVTRSTFIKNHKKKCG